MADSTEGAVCPRCRSPKWMSGVEVCDSDHGISHLRVHGGRRETWKDLVTAQCRLLANVCGECGHTELVAEKPDLLYQTYRKIGN